MKTWYIIKHAKSSISIADVGLYKDQQKALITRINVPRKHRGQGHARTLLREICADADAEGITLELEPIPGDGNMGLSHQQLVRWYGRYGFIYDETNNTMLRPPRGGNDGNQDLQGVRPVQGRGSEGREIAGEQPGAEPQLPDPQRRQAPIRSRGKGLPRSLR